MKKKRIIAATLSLAICFSSIMTASASLHPENNVYNISDINQLKKTIQELDVDRKTPNEVSSRLLSETDPKVIEEFASEKLDEAIDAMSLLGNIELTYDGQDNTKTTLIELDDGCWVEIALASEKISNQKIGAQVPSISPMYFQDQSGSNASEWKSYGDYVFTAKATVFYLVASATITLKNYYTLSSNGITINRGLPAASSSGLMAVSPGSYEITDKYAKTPGESDVNMQCTYQISYGYAPIEWSKTAIMYSTIRYAGRDTIEDEIHVSEVWRFEKRVS